MAHKRKHPRAPILTQVEARAQQFTSLGRATDISIGGLFIQTPETLKEGSTVIVRFYVPPDFRTIEAAGRVVRVEAGKSMGIAFLGLMEEHKRKILDYIQSHPTTAAAIPDEPPGGKHRRRSGRVPRRMSLVLSWNDEEGHLSHESTETQLLSRHGAKVVSFTGLQPGQLVRVLAPDTNKRDLCRIVWTQPAHLPGRVEIGLEILGDKNFWEMEFPPPEPASTTHRRRGARRAGRLEHTRKVALNWRDEWGRAREIDAETRVVSQHGALVSSPALLSINQLLRVREPATGREADARVVYTSPAETPGRIDVGIEFIGVDNFWNLAFPPDAGEPT